MLADQRDCPCAVPYKKLRASVSVSAGSDHKSYNALTAKVGHRQSTTHAAWERQVRKWKPGTEAAV